MNNLQKWLIVSGLWVAVGLYAFELCMRYS
jgi:hypothetical protein